MKNLIKNIDLKSSKDNIFFYTEFQLILRKIYIDNFKNIEFITDNLHFSLNAFSFLKFILENEYFTNNTLFLTEYFEIIKKCAELYIEKLFLINSKSFERNINSIDEFFNKISSIVESKYISSYNPQFYLTLLPTILNDLFMKFENFFLFICFHSRPKKIQDKLLQLSRLFGRNNFINDKIIDYINMFLIKHKGELSIFYIIDILSELSLFQESVNKQLLNYLYDKVKKINIIMLHLLYN